MAPPNLKQHLAKPEQAGFAKGVFPQWILLFLALLIFSAGLWISKESGRQTDLRMRRELARQIRSIAAAINPDDIRALSFSAEDAERPEFKRVSSQLRAYAESAGLRNVYTLALRDGQIVFGPESLRPDDPYASPPGTVFQTPTKKDFEIFQNGEATVQGPSVDEYGEFVTAEAPVIDSRTGNVLIAAGIDVEAAVWRAKIRKAQWIPFLTALIPLSILLAGCLILKIRRHASHTHHERLRHTEAVLCAIIMLLLTLTAALMIHVAEKKAREDAVHALVQIKAGTYVNAFKEIRNNLNMFVVFFESSEQISRDEFRTYCTPLLENSPIQACLWLPEIPGEHAAQFSAQVGAEDLPGFSIWQLNEQNLPVPAKGSTFYPLLYVEPLSVHQTAVGYDLHSEPLRRAAIEEALCINRITSTDPINLIALPGTPPGFFIFKRVSSKQSKGMAGFAIRPEMLLSSRIHNPAGETQALSITLFLLRAGETPRWMACSLTTSDQNCWETLRTGLHASVPVFAFGKTYSLLIAATPQWLAAHPLYRGKAALFIGLILTVLLTTLIAILANRPALLEKLAQQRTAELQQNQARLHTLVETIPDLIWLKDPDGVYLSCNAAFERLYGAKEAEIIGKTDYDFVDKEQADFFREHNGKVMAKGGPGITEEWLTSADSGSRSLFETIKTPVLDAEGNVTGVLGVARDITERKKAEEALRRLSTAIEQSPETVMITDTKGVIQYVNPAFETISGYTREEALGLNPRILNSGQHEAKFYSNLWKTITSGEIWNGRFINKRKDGVLYTEEATISPVRDSTGTTTGYVAVKRDITEDLFKEEQFRQAQKMEAVGQLAGGVAHDFNNILQAILGFSEILLNKMDSKTEEYRYGTEIEKAARRASDLTQQLLAFSRKQSVNKQRLNLNGAVRDAEILLHMLLGGNIRCTLDLAADLHPIYADSGQLTQIIMNLAVNARDAMPDGGRLNIATENIHFDPQTAASLPDAEPGHFVCLSVTDTGTGMTQEVKDHLFEPFFTTKSVGKGTGLGLAVVYGIVKQSKGWMHVYSELGKGTTFKIYLPTGDPSIPAPFGAIPEDQTGILLVEDDIDTRNLVLRILKPVGYEIITASTAEEALDLFNQSPAGFIGLLFSDVILPGQSGIDLAEELRKKSPDLPILLFSGYRDPRERWTEIDRKGYFFLQKPFSVTSLLAAVHDTLAAQKR